MPNFRKFVGVVRAGQMLHTYSLKYRQRVSYRTFPFRRSKSKFIIRWSKVRFKFLLPLKLGGKSTIH